MRSKRAGTGTQAHEVDLASGAVKAGPRIPGATAAQTAAGRFAPRQAGYRGASYSHNGSEVLVDERTGIIRYETPKASIRKAVGKGTALFSGTFGKGDTVVLAGGGYLWWRDWRSRRKVIRDYPKPGDKRAHTAGWKGENFDRLLSRYVRYARSANAIDETRKDFDRVAWGGIQDGAQAHPEGPARLVQRWFAGNHSDIGGSYPETESRLSDIPLRWVIEEATRIPDGLRLDGLTASGDATGNPKLHLFPAADGVQHCQIAGMHDTIERSVPKVLRRFSGSGNWASQVRKIVHDAPVHPTVVERFALPSVVQCAGSGRYRPKALAGHDSFKDFYDGPAVR